MYFFVQSRFIYSAKNSIIALILLLAAGCTVQLAPSFSQNLLDGLTEANESTQILFQRLSGGSKSSDFSDFSDDYIEAIGKLKALEILADARDTPPISQRGIQWLRSRDVLTKLCPEPADCINPTPSILATTYERIEQMANIHERAGVDSLTVDSVHNFVSSQFDLVISFETALQR